MNKFVLFLVVAIACSISSTSADTCTIDASNAFKSEFSDMQNSCTLATEEQIKLEVTASLNYLNMAAFFAKDDVNRPGFAKLFFAAASEEREHAYKLIEYLSMRGRYLKAKDQKIILQDFDISNLITSFKNQDTSIKLTPAADSKDSTSGLMALQEALRLEKRVTSSIRNLIKRCESDDDFNHYHFVDYLTGEFLEEQYKGQRDLAGKISTLAKMVKDQDNNKGAQLADFLFDKQLL